MFARSPQQSGYLLVSLCLMLLVMSTLVWSMSRTVLTGNLVQADRRMDDVARECALTGRDLVIRKTRLDDQAGGSGAWRSKAAAGGYNFVDSSVAGGKVTTRLVDPGGNFTDKNWETAVLYCTGVVGDVRYTFKETLAPARPAALMHTVFSGADVELKSRIALVHGSLYANAKITPADRKLTGDGYAGTTISATVLGKEFINQGALPVPAPDLSWYMAVGTVIPRKGTYSKMIFSPTSNPFGPPNPYGVYIIQPAGGDIVFQNCRIIGTIVYANANDRKVKFEKGILLESASREQLTLLIAGNDKTKIEFNWAKEIKEDGNGNFNPAGTPYPWRGGASDADEDDKYQSRLEGGVWCSGEIEMRNDKFTMQGTIGSAKTIKFRGHAGWVTLNQFLPLRGMEGWGLMSYPGTLAKL